MKCKETSIHKILIYKGTCKGFTFTTKQCMKLLNECLELTSGPNGTSLHLCCDGTYNMVNNQWPLVILCVLRRHYDRSNREYRHTAIPIMWCLAYSESTNSTNALIASYLFAGKLLTLSTGLSYISIIHSSKTIGFQGCPY